MTGTGTYDPFELDKPKVRLGEGREWTIADATDAHIKRADKADKDLAKLSKRVKPAPSVADFAKLVGDFCEDVCDDAEGLSALVQAACDPEAAKAAGRKPVGIQGVIGLANHVFAWFRAEDSAGNV